MAVNVGYSIGWGYPIEIDEAVQWFSTMYVLTGASAVAAALGYFAQSMIQSSKNWYTDAIIEEELNSNSNLLQKVYHFLQLRTDAIKLVVLWFLWIAALVIFSMVNVKWTFTNAVFFAVSSLSTAGLFPIPNDSPSWYFGIGMFMLKP